MVKLALSILVAALVLFTVDLADARTQWRGVCAGCNPGNPGCVGR